MEGVFSQKLSSSKRGRLDWRGLGRNVYRLITSTNATMVRDPVTMVKCLLVLGFPLLKASSIYRRRRKIERSK